MKKKTFLLLLFILVMCTGVVIKNPFILNMLSMAALTVIVVTGLNLLLGFAGQISLGHAGFVALGAYISSIGYPTLKLKSHYLAMATLAIGEIIHIIVNNYVELTGGPQGFSGMPMLSFFGFTLDNETKFYFFIWPVTFLLILLSINLVESRFGRAYKAIKSKENAAYAFGVNVHMYKVFIFTVSVFYASLSGALYAFYIGFISPSSFGLTQSIDYIVMVVIGGMGNFFGIFFTTIILSILPNILTSIEDYWPIVNGLLLIFAMMVIPNGMKRLFSWIK